MKWSFASVGLIVLGLVGITIIMLFEQITTSNENDYYLLKEVTEAAMIDAIDISYYRDTGELKIVKEKFVENFTRRFSESTLLTGTGYTINFYDIIETPPKVSVIIDTGLGKYTIHQDTSDYNISNKLDGILEYNGKYTNVGPTDIHYNNPYESKTLEKIYYAIPGKSDNTFEALNSIRIPEELIGQNIKNVKISEITKKENVVTNEELNKALLQRELTFVNAPFGSTNYLMTIDKISGNIQTSDFKICNCDDDSLCTNIQKNEVKCDNSNKYWVLISGTTNESDKESAIIKYEITWSYEEYEYAE